MAANPGPGLKQKSFPKVCTSGKLSQVSTYQSIESLSFQYNYCFHLQFSADTYLFDWQQEY